MRDGAWAQRQDPIFESPIYWIITEQATGIGYDRSFTVDYYREQTPASCLAAFVWDGLTWEQIPEEVDLDGDDCIVCPGSLVGVTLTSGECYQCDTCGTEVACS